MHVSDPIPLLVARALALLLSAAAAAAAAHLLSGATFRRAVVEGASLWSARRRAAALVTGLVMPLWGLSLAFDGRDGPHQLVRLGIVALAAAAGTLTGLVAVRGAAIDAPAEARTDAAAEARRAA
jgi:hypothetical protein